MRKTILILIIMCTCVIVCSLTEYALNCRLQVEKVNPEGNYSDKYSLSLALRSLRFIHYVNVSILIKFSQNTSVLTLIIISSP